MVSPRRGLWLRSMVSSLASASSSSVDMLVTWLEARLRWRRLGKEGRTAGMLSNWFEDRFSWVRWFSAGRESGSSDS